MNKVVLPLIIAVIAACAGVFLYQKTMLAQPEHSLYYENPREVKAFEFTDHNGQAFTNSQLENHWTWVFFGYTSCPDICPTTLQELNFVYDDLKAVANNTQVLMVSVDPNRDTQARLSQYIPYFNDEFFGLTAGHDVLFPFSRNLGLMYSVHDDTTEQNYLVDHSASVVLINPAGKIAAIFKPDHELGKLPIVKGDDLLADFSKIVRLH
ncbi:SCO family protein [Thalassotalea sp. LPB0316]|uniref:SCO family protein n=1 Tax=Thalassotalea sp. LPB0316 TaxID=2769490 RepID=UPI001868D2DA|nr:SCO family protein [Thalassotalea sp. LPB0316]QOL26212.1 SCO family protein [Thalassotalea sp. LPB0316]